MAMLVSWCEAEEARAMEINTSRANIDVQLKRAKLYRAAGGYDVAWETLAAVCETAGSDESAQDLYREAMDIADEMRRTSEERSEIK
jgi:histidinol phosphatase-like PHP family hydrolase